MPEVKPEEEVLDDAACLDEQTEIQVTCKHCGISFFIDKKLSTLLRDPDMPAPVCIFGHTLEVVLRRQDRFQYPGKKGERKR